MNSPMLARAASWLTERRVRRHALLLGLVLWSVYAVDLATPGLRDRSGLLKAVDFLHFYTLGSLAAEGRGDLLYDARAQAAESLRQVPESAGVFFQPVYGPQVALLFAPLARLPFAWAAFLWIALSALLYALCVHAVWRSCPQLRAHGNTLLLLAAAYPAFFQLLAHGQTSALALACFTAAYLALRAERRLLAGIAIGLLVYKPQLGIAAAVVFVLGGEWRVMAGAVLAAGAQLAAGWAYFGTPAMQAYAATLRALPQMASVLEPKLYQMHSLRAFWSLLVPWAGVAMALYVVTAVAALAWAVWAWRSSAPLSLRYAAFLLATVLVTPHLTVYDLVVLAPALLVLGDWALANPGHRMGALMRVALYASFALPLLGAVTRATHVQLSVVAFAALAWATAVALRDGAAMRPEQMVS
ncbi:MAG: glycosyltransferase family 87 protein [Terriglobales bacterium]